MSASADVNKVWNGLPITMHLPVGKETRIIFPTEVDVQVPMGVSNKLQSLAPNPSVVYWTATESFDRARIFAFSLDGDSVYILDVAASEAGLKGDVTIEDPDRVLESHSLNKSESSSPTAQINDPAPIVLTRFVSQALYAPKRLVPTNSDVNKVDTPFLPNDFPLMRSSKGESFKYDVVGQWNGYGIYLTALMLTNTSNFSAVIEPSNVRGRFTHATAQHAWVGASGALDDRTTLYLVSNIPFQDAIMGDDYAY